MTYDDFKQEIEAKWRAAQCNGPQAQARIYEAVKFRLMKRPVDALASVAQLVYTCSDPGIREQYAGIVRRLAQLPEVWG